MGGLDRFLIDFSLFLTLAPPFLSSARFAGGTFQDLSERTLLFTPVSGVDGVLLAYTDGGTSFGTVVPPRAVVTALNGVPTPTLDAFIAAASSIRNGDAGAVQYASSRIPADPGTTGSVTLVHGFWPAGEGVAEQVGSSFDLFLSRNTLKRGYVNPVFPVPDRHRVTLGVEDDAFLGSIHDALKPGGLAMIYNIGLGEAGEGEDYVAMRDIHDPFPPEAWEAAGFELVAYDVDDSEAARAVGRGLDWDEGERAMDLDELFGRYTIARRAD